MLYNRIRYCKESRRVASWLCHTPNMKKETNMRNVIGMDDEQTKKVTKNSNAFAGFSLLEVMVVMVIVGLLGVFVGPELIDWGPNMRLKRAATDFQANMQKAKLEAIRRNSNVVITITSVACPGLPDAVPIAGGSYSIFVDDGGTAGTAGDGILDAGEEQFVFSGDDDEATPNVYEIQDNSALCGETFGGATGFTSRGLLTSAAGNVTFNNDRGKSYIVSLSVAGGVSL